MQFNYFIVALLASAVAHGVVIFELLGGRPEGGGLNSGAAAYMVVVAQSGDGDLAGGSKLDAAAGGALPEEEAAPHRVQINRVPKPALRRPASGLPGPKTEILAGSGGGLPGSRSVQILRFDKPEYPPLARLQGLEGRAVFSVTVGAGGEVIYIDLTETSGSKLLDKAAYKAVGAASYAPAVIDGTAVTAVKNVAVAFKLDY